MCVLKCGQKSAPYPLKLELQMIVNSHVSDGTQTQVVCKSSKCSQLLEHLSISLGPLDNFRSYHSLFRIR